MVSPPMPLVTKILVRYSQSSSISFFTEHTIIATRLIPPPTLGISLFLLLNSFVADEF